MQNQNWEGRCPLCEHLCRWKWGQNLYILLRQEILPAGVDFLIYWASIFPPQSNLSHRFYLLFRESSVIGPDFCHLISQNLIIYYGKRVPFLCYVQPPRAVFYRSSKVLFCRGFAPRIACQNLSKEARNKCGNADKILGALGFPSPGHCRW